MSDPAAVALWRKAIYRVGVAIVISRPSGYAPHVTTFSVNLTAKVALAQPDSAAPLREGLGARGAGAVTQDERTVILMASDLSASRFPLPIQKGDLVTLPDTSEQFTVAFVDSYALAIAGAIKLTIAGVA